MLCKYFKAFCDGLNSPQETPIARAHLLSPVPPWDQNVPFASLTEETPLTNPLSAMQGPAHKFKDVLRPPCPRECSAPSSGVHYNSAETLSSTRSSSSLKKSTKKLRKHLTICYKTIIDCAIDGWSLGKWLGYVTTMEEKSLDVNNPTGWEYSHA